MSKRPAVYIMASTFNGTLYVGVTGDLVKRVWQHRTNATPGFTSRYAVHRLVHFEMHGTMAAAIHRETQIKRWRRGWKINLIQKDNPEWTDLWPLISGDEQDGFPPARE
jgi:putative endonuclease